MQQGHSLMSRIEDQVCRLILHRADFGLNKYGVTVERTDLSEIDWLKHARDEAMDLAVYLTRLIDDKTQVE
jgi:hypothetical protein